MLFKQDPSKDIVFSRIPNFYIEDKAGVFDLGLGLLAYPFNSDNYLVDGQPIKLYLYTQYDPIINFPNLSSNEIAIIITVTKNEVQLRIELSDFLLKKSRFKAKKELIKTVVVIKDRNEIIGKTISIAYLLSFFDDYNELLFPVDYAKEVMKAQVKTINIQRKIGSPPFNSKQFADKVKGKLSIKIGLFFDGTNNSRYNSDHGCRKIYREVEKVNSNTTHENEKTSFEKILTEFRKKNDYDGLLGDGSSYLNDYTNIVYLYDLYKDQPYDKDNTENEIVIKQYIQGIGPESEYDENTKQYNYKEDSIWAQGTGTSPTKINKSGIDDRMREGIELIIKKLLSICQESQKEIGNITFDMFGFSRGATVARKFHNELLSKFSIFQGGISPMYEGVGGSFGNYFWDYFGENSIEIFLKKYPQKILTRFLGLFDTVNMTLNSAQNISIAHSNAYCCHIIARSDDEYRKYFPLTRSDAPNGIDLTLYGTHSDIGGGYANNCYRTIVKYDKKALSPNLSKVLNNYKSEIGKLFAITYKNSQLVSDTNQISIIERNSYENNPSAYNCYNNGKSGNQNQNQRYVNSPNTFELILLDKRIINNEIQKVSLNAMITIASKIGIQFNDELKDDFKINEKSTVLLQYNSTVQDLIMKAYETDNTTEITSYLPIEYYYNLYHEYIHISSHYNSFHLKGLINVNEPTEKRVREIIKP
ncbi:phospholipase effector Tle1 domain-containing protein [Chryseobacterium viscerum]|uniref:DUF2235 domain-containing protein n=1 Tax=Chryseobacterium viscerum TaxID=1037377 RepID=A0A5N4BVR9_9FLAO|nr:DUF2235 domain-containing protein [Chryseobacterium viscerum]KAB1232512.1 DUF2235 domain-containing protein [Chryseobacterium viscerum]